MSDNIIGQLIRGYEFSALLGKGGYGAVYRAFQPAVGRDVAVKIILPEHAANPEFTARFHSEAHLVARLEHPYIVPLYDYWQDESGAFLVMRLVKGGSLRDQLKQGTLDAKQVMRLFDHVGSALAIAHEAGVIHRDIKPDNILLDQYTNAYLTDFGIAKNLNLDIRNTISEDDIIGTPAYLSLEQIRSEAVTPQSDIYALGIMLYEVLTGEVPFDKPGMQVLMQHLQDPVPSLLEKRPDLPEQLDDIIQRATAKDPADRYESVMDMVEALREVFAPVVQTIIPFEAQPRTVDPNKHVFISYSREDNEFVQRLIYDLELEGIPVWVDKKGLKPGTRNWEDALRNAIRGSYAMILVASPASRKSNYVLDELAIAEMYKAPVYPVWVEGDEWADSVPPGMGKLLYIDARDENYTKALLELVMLLGVGASPEDLTRTTENIELPADFNPRNPYKGLRAFRENDQGDFFGRTGLVNDLLELLTKHTQPGASRLLAVIGPSGSGKSSVVMAGLLPALQRGALPDSERWSYVPPMVPGTNPLENLTIALSALLPDKSQKAIREDLTDPTARGLHTLARQIVDRQNSRLVLYIDQFEELFTQTAEEADRQQFINLLLTAVTEPGGPVLVLITLRADFYDRPMNYPELGQLIDTNSKSVLPMSLADLHDVIQKPAELSDVLLQFDPGLVAELVFEVRDQVGGLPLLQFTLEQLFERRNGRRLTNSAYMEIGGVRGALAKHTEATYTSLPTDQHRQLARGLFLRLIEPGATEQDTTRRRAPRNELVLADSEQNRMMDEVINAFVNARLLLADQSQGVTTIEVSHEALIREWGRLGTWLEEARSDITRQQNISADTAAWVDRGKLPNDDGLYRGTLLEDAQGWASRNLPSSDEAAFITASAKAQADRQAADERIARRVRNAGRAAAVLGVMSVIAIIAFIAAIFQVTGAQASLATATIAQGLALEQIGAANTQVAQVGETLTPVGATLVAGQALVSTAQTAVIEAQDQAARADQLVEEAGLTLTPIPQTLTPIGGTLAAANTEVAGVQPTLDSANTQVAGFEPTINAANESAALARTDVANAGETLTPIPLTLTPIGGTLAAAQTQVAGVQPTVDAANLAVGDARTTVANAGLTLTPIPQTLTPVGGTLSAANTQVAGVQPTVDAANLAVNDARTTIADAGLTLTPIPLTLTPVGGTLAAAETQVAGVQPTVDAANLAVFDARTTVADAGQTLTPIPLTLTPIGGTLAAANTQVAGVQPTLDAAGTQVAGVEPTVNAANQAVFDARTQIADAGLTLTPVPQTLTPVAATLAAAEEQIAGVQPTLDAAGTQIAGVEPTIAAAETQVADAGLALTPLAVTLVAAQSGALSQSLAVNAEQAINNEDYDLALALALESIRANPDLIQSQRLLNQLVYSSARFSFDNAPVSMLSPDGATLAVAEGNDIRLWDTATRTERLYLTGHTGAVTAVDFSPDSLTLVSASEDTTLIEWDTVSGAAKFTLSAHTARVNDVQFSQDGALIISGGDDGANYLWNARDGSLRDDYIIGAGRTVEKVQFYPNATRFWSWEQAGPQTVLVFWATDRANPLWTSDKKDFIAFVPDNLTYAFRANDSSTQVTIWDAANSTEQPLRTLDATRLGTPTAKGFSPQGGIALVAFARPDEGNTQIVLWNYTNSSTENLVTLQGVDRSEAIAFNDTGSLAAIGFGKFIVLYDMINRRELRRLAAHSDIVNYLKFSPDGRYLFSRSKNDNARVWDVTGGDPAQVQTIVARTQNNTITYPGISPDGSEVYAGLIFSLFGWDLNTAAQNTRVEVGDRLLSVVYSPVQPYALAVMGNASSLWDMSVRPNAAFKRTYGSASDNNTGAAAFTYDGVDVVIAGNDLALRDLATNGRQVIYDTSMIARNSEIISLAVSPDNKYLVGVSGIDYQPGQTRDPDEVAQDIIVWDLVTGSVLRTFGADHHSRRINQVAVSPSSRLVISASEDGTLIVWDIETGRFLSRLAGHRGAVNAAVFTPDGRYAISASDDATMILWDLETGQLLRTFNGHTSPVLYLAISRDGRNFVSASGDDRVIVWEFETVGDTIAWTIQNRYVRELTCDEGRQFGLTSSCDAAGNLITATPLPGSDGTAVAGGGSSSPFDFTPSPTSQPCFINTTRTDVPIRVGPGTDRTARIFLIPNRNMLVTGKTVLASGAIWWRIRPSDVTTELDRYWVAETDVEEVGGCDAVPDASTTAATSINARENRTQVPQPTGIGSGSQPTPTPVATQEACSVPLSPNGAGSMSGTVTFSWTGMASADQYYLIIYNADGGALVFNDATSSTSATLNTSGFPPNINWTAAPYRGGVQLCTSNYVFASRP